MRMAIHSAKLASENIIDFLENRINRATLETNYLNDWNKNFKKKIASRSSIRKAIRT
jgi:flavin-dependent dehydrogenase